MKRYQIRFAAGFYWVLDMEQEGMSYRRPVALNECGRFLFERYISGESEEAMAQALREEYEVEQPEAQEDVRSFCREMKAVGIRQEVRP